MQKYTAIILSSHDVGEYDRLYVLYTREIGVVKTIGRGVRKQSAKLAGHLEPVTLSEVYVARARGMGQITSAISILSFENIGASFEKLEEALRIFRFFTRHFSEEEKDEEIFDLLKEYLEILNGETDGSGLAKEAFWWKLFDALGHRPETMKCAKCGAGLEDTARKFFSAERGGAICEKCFSDGIGLAKISSDQIKLLRIFLANPLGKILKVKAGEVELRSLARIRDDFRKYNF